MILMLCVCFILHFVLFVVYLHFAHFGWLILGIYYDPIFGGLFANIQYLFIFDRLIICKYR